MLKQLKDLLRDDPAELRWTVVTLTLCLFVLIMAISALQTCVRLNPDLRGGEKPRHTQND